MAEKTINEASFVSPCRCSCIASWLQNKISISFTLWSCTILYKPRQPESAFKWQPENVNIVWIYELLCGMFYIFYYINTCISFGTKVHWLFKKIYICFDFIKTRNLKGIKFKKCKSLLNDLGPESSYFIWSLWLELLYKDRSNNATWVNNGHKTSLLCSCTVHLLFLPRQDLTFSRNKLTLGA